MNRRKILLTAWDGAGCVPPLMSVVRALTSRGHDVRVLADPVIAHAAIAAGARHVSWSTAPHRHDRSLGSWFIEDWGPDGFFAMRDSLAVGPAGAFAADLRAEIDREPPDLVLTEGLLLGSLLGAEAAGVPCVVLNTTINMMPVEGVPPFGPGFAPATTDAERALHREVAEAGTAAWDGALPAMNRARTEHGLPPLEHVLDQYRSAALLLVMTSETFDFTGPVPPVVRYVGPRLDDVLDAGTWTPPQGDDPLVLVSLSSEFQDQVDVLSRATDALAQLPVRGVVTTGRAIDPDSVPAAPHVQVLQLAPHRQILAEASVVVTHCGHGTTIKSLAAGVPLVCLPMGRDQNDVAARVVHRGAGVRLDPASSPEEIAAAVRTVLDDPAYSAAARRLAAAIAEETREDRAVLEIEALLAGNGAEAPAVAVGV